MSGQQIGSVVGGVIGAYFGGQFGYAIGSAIGGAIGGYVDPTVIKGPKLTDATQQTASDGIPIPWGHGTFPTSGNIIWASELFERKKEDDGKGTGVVNVTYHYYRSYAIGICQGVRQSDGTYLPIEGILQVTRNGKVVYDVQPGVSSEQLAQNTKFMRETRFYLGSETQDPDSVIESHEGVGNAPAYPGTVYMVRENIELTESGGAIEQFGFVVSICGETVLIPSTGTNWIASIDDGGTIKPSVDGLDWETQSPLSPVPITDTGNLFYGSNGTVLYTNVGPAGGGSTVAIRDTDGNWTAPAGIPSMDALGGDATYASGFWHLTRSASGSEDITRYSDAGTWSTVATAPSANVIARGGSHLVALDSLSRQIYHAPLNGSEWTTGVILPFPFAVSADGSGNSLQEVGFVSAVQGSYGGGGSNNDYRLYLSRSVDDGLTFNDQTTPLPDVIDAAPDATPRLRYDATLGFWLVSFQNRVASGPNLASLSLCTEVFSSAIFGIGSDGTKFVVCGEFGFKATSDGINFVDLPTDVTGVITSVVAIGSLSGDAVPDAPGWYIDANGQLVGPGGDELQRCKPTLGEIVADACLRSGLTLDDIDVSELTDEVDGFKVATETTAEAIISPLMSGFFFDAAEFDDKIRFIKRGGDVVGEITYDQLCESDGDVIEETELQEAELLRKVNVRTIDPAAGFTVTTQIAERRTSTVLAKGEQTTEIPVVTDKDTQARMADKKLKVGWSETRRLKTCIPYTLPQYTPTDVIGLTDGKGKRQRVRLMEMAEDSGRIEIREAMLDRQSSYTSNVEGVAQGAPTNTTPGLVGPTFGVPMNLPRLRSGDIGPGAYLSACGYLRGWGGCSVLLSVDGGASYQEVMQFLEPSSMGVLYEDCTESSEPISVFMNSGSLSSITDDQIALRQNAFAITTGGVSELGQFRDAVIDSGGIYDLTNTLRGGLGTTPAAHSEGDPFVMAASARLLPLDISLAGQTLYFKFVSFGTSADDTTAIPFVFNPMFFGAPTIEPYMDENGEIYVDELGETYYSEE